MAPRVVVDILRIHRRIYMLVGSSFAVNRNADILTTNDDLGLTKMLPLACNWRFNPEALRAV